MRIISRQEWGGGPVRQTRRVASSAVQEFAVHYHDGRPQHRTGAAVPKFIEQMHRARGWSDIGYGFVIDTNGQVFEGRGWNVMGAHAGSGYGNRQIGVQLHIGGNQAPSPAMLNALVWLYRQARNRYGRWLRPTGHNDYSATSCPGPHKASILAALRASQAGTAPAPAPKPDTRTDIERLLDTMNEKQLGDLIFTKSKEGTEAAMWGKVVDSKDHPNAAGHVVDSSWRNNIWALHTGQGRILAVLNELAKRQGIKIDVAELAGHLAGELGDELRARLLEEGVSEDIAQRAADIIGERVNAGAQGEVA